MTAWMDEDLRQRREAGLLRTRRKLSSGQGVEVRHHQVDCVNFSSNDYLAYAGDSRLARAVARAVHRWGCGSGASPLVSGHLPPLRQLERALASWEDFPAALVFPTGFQANVATVSTLIGEGDAIFSDALNHASLIDGCRLSRARTHVYRHNDMVHLEELLRTEGNQVRRRLILSDTVFSMEGDLADPGLLLGLARKYDALLVLDEAHATGVIGVQGRGVTDTLSQEDLHDERLIKLGTLSKALGSQGGFVCGSKSVIEYLINYARGYIYSTALAPALAASARLAVRLVQEEPERRQHLLDLAIKLRAALQNHGFDVGKSSSQIISIKVGEPAAAVQLSQRLAERKLLVPAIRPPSVPAGTSRLRISLTAGHTEEDIARLIQALRTAT